MLASLLMLTQIAAAPEAELLPIDFDIRTVPPVASGEEIVVYGSRVDQHRLRPMPQGNFADRPLKAEADLGGGASASIVTEQADMQAGVQSKRAMVRLQIPF